MTLPRFTNQKANFRKLKIGCSAGSAPAQSQSWQVAAWRQHGTPPLADGTEGARRVCAFCSLRNMRGMVVHMHACAMTTNFPRRPSAHRELPGCSGTLAAQHCAAVRRPLQLAPCAERRGKHGRNWGDGGTCAQRFKFFIAPINWKWSSVGEIWFQN